MNKVLVLTATLLLSGAALAQKTYNDPNAIARPVKGFHAIRVSGGIYLYLVQGNEEAVAVSAADKEYRDRIITEVTDDGVLKIYYDHKWTESDWNGKKLKAYVSCKTLDGLRVSAGSHVDVDGSVHSNQLNIDVSSGGSFKGDVRVTDLKAQASSGGHSTISGTAATLTTAASSGGHLDADELQADVAEANASSGARIELYVNKELSATANSGGHIHYRGNAVIKDLDTGSGGAVSNR